MQRATRTQSLLSGLQSPCHLLLCSCFGSKDDINIATPLRLYLQYSVTCAVDNEVVTTKERFQLAVGTLQCRTVVKVKEIGENCERFYLLNMRDIEVYRSLTFSKCIVKLHHPQTTRTGSQRLQGNRKAVCVKGFAGILFTACSSLQWTLIIISAAIAIAS